MRFTRKKASHSSIIQELSEREKEDSLNAAQFTFRQHSNEQHSSSPVSLQGDEAIRQPEPRHLIPLTRFRSVGRSSPDRQHPIHLSASPLVSKAKGGPLPSVKRRSKSVDSEGIAVIAANLANNYISKPNKAWDLPRSDMSKRYESPVTINLGTAQERESLSRDSDEPSQTAAHPGMKNKAHSQGNLLDRDPARPISPEDNLVSALSLSSEEDNSLIASESDSIEISETPESYLDSNYKAVTKMNGNNITYKGTLPNLIPNYDQKQRRKKKISRLLKHARPFKAFSHQYVPNVIEPNVTVVSNNSGNTVVETDQNVQLKTSLRLPLYANSDDTSETDDENDYVDDHSSADDKPKLGRRDKLKRRIKRTTKVVVPHPHLPLHHHLNTVKTSRKQFNKDKPWKSHVDLGFVTEMERKRYESMWISNRFQYLNLLPWWPDNDSENQVKTNHPLPPDGLILGLVVKDIWLRSNLPMNILATIYQMIDFRMDGTLDRKSFIVGMWLIDQCLYGKKLPDRIEPKIWNSVDTYIIEPRR